uniref:G_PROTEIN_RECEP_F1_2 domain-containing protein n=1 Tax=Caenorhabditis tropicalis TaxID=1561998 RepID=A0A1I7U5L4_9PELO
MNSTTTDTHHGIPQCASDLQMYQRNSWLFKTNVISNTVIAVVTLVLSVKTFRMMKKKPVFSVSTSFLIQLLIVVVNVHEFIYAFIQLWSIYRAFVYWNDPCRIMFNEYECFDYYIANIGSRLLMLFSLCAVTIDRILSIWLPRLPSNKKRGGALFLVGVVLAAILCRCMTDDGPNDNIQSNCYQRMGRNIDELKQQISMYLYVIIACFLLNLYALGHSWWLNKKQKRFNINEQVEKQIEENSALAIIIIVFFQLICLATYSFSVNSLIDHVAMFDPKLTGNLVLWCYTYPYACVSLPIGILIATGRITTQRRERISLLTETNQGENQRDHFKKLSGAWNNEFEMKQTHKVAVKID